jgi:thiol-disulfide isomerase/thioredoxin
MTTLLLGYQKGDAVSKDIVEKLGLKKEKIYVVDFFASWCGSCKKEMPHLSQASERANKRKIEFIGIDVDEDIAKGKSFQKELREDKKLTFKVIDDPKNEIIKEFDPIGMPALFFIKDLKVADALLGATDDIDKKIENILKGLK